MIAVILNWIYIMIICTLAGIGIMKPLFLRGVELPAIVYPVSGIVAVTVYAEIFSIFGRVNMLCHLILLIVVIVIAFLERSRIAELWVSFKNSVVPWEIFFYCCFILFVAFYTSRGEFHTDTNIYHAQMIRLYEEYGMIKGMGNLQLHYGYNSAYLAFASVFSMRWLTGQSLHTVTGFLETFMCIYAFHGLRDFMRHRFHMADMLKVGILFYTMVILDRSMSPATDYGTMLFSLFLITAWCDNMENRKDLNIYCLLSVLAVFVMTLKFSAALLGIIVVYPAFLLIKDRKWKEIAGFVAYGCIILIPFLIRNYLISGWLLYPFNGIDIFHAVWKVPEEYLLKDANQIKVWGRCLYDVNKIDWPVRQWLPVWWEHQQRYEKMFIGAFLISMILLAVVWLRKLICKKKIGMELIILVSAVIANLALWFFLAPFIRYGLAFLIAGIAIAVGAWLNEQKQGFYSILTGGLMFLIIVSLTPYLDNYVTDIGVFTKHSLKEPYYLQQKDYDRTETGSLEINGNVIYYPVEGEINSYHNCPSTCYKWMAERSTLMGETLEDGFMPIY
ncbi:MAG: hypothetical protein K2J99_06075 [Lachnospiraceae bacterium]|nr:hypothetical protein [Lachnospiraceae bacterium]